MTPQSLLPLPTQKPCFSPMVNPRPALTCRHGMSPEKLKVPMTSSPILYTVLKMQKVPTFPRLLLILYRSMEKAERGRAEGGAGCTSPEEPNRHNLAAWEGRTGPGSSISFRKFSSDQQQTTSAWRSLWQTLRQAGPDSRSTAAGRALVCQKREFLQQALSGDSRFTQGKRPTQAASGGGCHEQVCRQVRQAGVLLQALLLLQEGV